MVVCDPFGVGRSERWRLPQVKTCGYHSVTSSRSLFDRCIFHDPLLNSHDLWLAKPRGEMPDVPNCKFWQFTHDGHVWGIIDNVVDINQFNGTKEELQDYINTKGISQKG